MKIRPLYLALMLIGLHGAAHAGLIKCKTPSGGYTLQDRPCAPDASKPEAKRPVPGEKDPNFAQRNKERPGPNWERRTPIAHENRPNFPVPVQSSAPEPAARVQPTRPSTLAHGREPKHVVERDYLSRRADEETQAYNDQVKARNRMHDCNYARQQLGVVKDGGRISSRNNKGEREYVGDAERPATIAAAEREVARTCM